MRSGGLGYRSRCLCGIQRARTPKSFIAAGYFLGMTVATSLGGLADRRVDVGGVPIRYLAGGAGPRSCSCTGSAAGH